MNTQKGVLIGVGIGAFAVVLLCAGLIWLFASFFLGMSAWTQPLPDGANDFLGQLGQGKTSEAYASTASALRARYNEASFTAAVNQLGLTSYVSSSWDHRVFDDQGGYVEGTVTTQKGQAPATVRLVREQGTWRVVGLHYAGKELDVVMTALTPAGGKPAPPGGGNP